MDERQVAEFDKKIQVEVGHRQGAAALQGMMSGLDAEEDAEVDGALRLIPIDLDGFE